MTGHHSCHMDPAGRPLDAFLQYKNAADLVFGRGWTEGDQSWVWYYCHDPWRALCSYLDLPATLQYKYR